jgi:hypothetical protein
LKFLRCLLVVSLAFLYLDGQAAVLPEDAGGLIRLSQDLLYAVKTEGSTVSFEAQLSKLSQQDLVSGLSNDSYKNLFWINLYNAWYQIFAIREKLERPHIFMHRGINFKGFSLSLDEIEHGILRRYRSKFSLGYLPKLFPEKTIKLLAVQKPDYRIHFALNCGARSCPPIVFYELDTLDAQLDVAARTYLQNETRVDSVNGVIYTTKLMEWYMADFGGKKGCLKILSKFLNADFSGYALHFKDYDWQNDLMNFGS